MYPFRDGLTYPRNAWYVAAFSHEVTRTPMERELLGEPVVFYRTEDGRAVAVDGRCPHRRFPMVRARVTGDALECGYHGWTFDAGGTCTRIPSQADFVPAGFRIPTYVLSEQWKWIWIWMGDPAKADPSLIPDHRELHLTESDWHAEIGGMEPMKARYQLMNENVLDLVHISFTHARTIGTPNVATGTVEFEARDGMIHYERHVPGESPTAFHRATYGLPDLVDRVLVTDFYPPAFLASGSRFFEPGQSRIPGGTLIGEHRVFHTATPANPTNSYYFWAHTRSFAQGDDAITQALATGWHAGVMEDVEAIEATESMIDRGRPMHDLSAKADAAALRGRRLVEAMMLAEREPAKTAVSVN
jgi:vanillate O-demethylase monooxygenase subunit